MRDTELGREVGPQMPRSNQVLPFAFSCGDEWEIQLGFPWQFPPAHAAMLSAKQDHPHSKAGAELPEHNDSEVLRVYAHYILGAAARAYQSSRCQRDGFY